MSQRVEWVTDHSRKREAPGSYDAYADTLFSCMKQIRSGITTTVHSHIYMDGPVEPYEKATRAVLNAYRDSGIRCAFALGIRDRHSFSFIDDAEFMRLLPDDIRSDPGFRVPAYDMSFADFHGLLKRLSAEFSNIQFQLGPWNPVFCSNGLLEKIADVSALENWRIQTHFVETRYQAEYARQCYGKSATAFLNDIGMLSERFSGAHSIWVDGDDIALLKQAGSQVVYNPASNMRLASGIAPVQAYLEAGVVVAFGLDSLSIGDDEDVFNDLRLGQVIQNRPGLDEVWLGAETLLSMATASGAVVAGMADIGSLVAGNRADIILLDKLQFGFAIQPLAEIVVRRAKAEHVRSVIVDGEILLEDGQWTNPDFLQLESRLVDSMGVSAQKKSRFIPSMKAAMREVLGVDGAP